LNWTRPRRCGRRAAGLLWVGALLLTAGGSLPLVAAQTPPEPPAEPPPRPPAAPSDTTGQAALRWQVERPRRAASLIVADRTVYRMVGNEAISYYYGNVYLDRDTVVVRADSAHVFRDRDLVRLFDNVRIRHYDSRITSDWAEYRRDLGEVDLRGHVRVIEADALASGRFGELRDNLQLLRLYEDALLVGPDYTVRADTLLRDRRLDYGEAFGRVRVMNPDGGSLVTGRHGRFAADGSWAEVDRDPAFETREEGGDPVRSVARNMRFFEAEERVVMTDSVRIAQGHLRAFADTAISYGRERMVLLGTPHLEQGDRRRMYGEQIEFYYRDGALYRVILLGQARMEDSEPDSLAALYRGLPALDVIEGDSITVHFRQGRIQRTDVIGRAHSIYVPVDQRDEVAYNDVKGDTLVLRFADQRVREVEVRGNMSGVYHFANLARLRGPQPAGLDSAAVDSRAALARVDSLAARAGVDSLRAAAADSAAAANFLLASAASLLAAADSLATAASATLDFAGRAEQVDYSGHRVLFDLPGRSIAVSHDARLTYGTMTLGARDVVLDIESRELYADGDPVLEDKETIVGKQMGYDFANKTGAVREGVTTFDGYYYAGDAINRYPDGSLKICSGRMTSCDREQPHYHFWADKMKMRLGDRVVGAPVVMHVGHVPIFALPFYFKSLKEGRRSGILFPNFNFGWSSREGRYIRDLGYFWATNDYTDFTFEIDYNERRELAWRVRNRYVKRDAFTGGFDYNRLKKLEEESGVASEWQFNWVHDQPKLFDDYKVNVKVQMASQELSRNNLAANTGRDIIDSYLKSSAYVSRTTSFGGMSLNAERTEYINARDDDPTTDEPLYAMTLPSLSLSVKQWTLGRELGPGERSTLLGALGRNTTFSQGYSLSSQDGETEETRTRRQAANGNWGLTLRPPRVGIFNVNFGANSAWAWTRTDVAGYRYDSSDSTWTDITDVVESSRPSVSFSSGVSTTLYGVFPVRLGPLQAIRHTLNLTTGVSYRPQLGSKQERGNSYSFSVGNRFDVKYLGRSDRDTTATAKKIDGLIDWGLSTSYNPEAERGWGQIGSSVTFRPGTSRNLNFTLKQAVDPYAWHVVSTQFTYGFGFSGRFDTGYAGHAREDERSAAIERLGPAGVDSLAAAGADTVQMDDSWGPAGQMGEPDDYYGGNFGGLGGAGGAAGRDETEGGRFIPWNLGGSLSLNRRTGADETTARASINLGARLTRDWDFRYSASFDLAEGTTTRQEYRLQRDLHCWRLEFTRTVSSTNSEFGFRFYLKAIPELKLTRGREDLLGTAGGLGSLLQ